MLLLLLRVNVRAAQALPRRKTKRAGQFRFANGDMYQGEFVDGFFRGWGTIFSEMEDLTVNFLEERSMRTECTPGKTEIVTSENGRTIKCTGLVPSQMAKKFLFYANITTVNESERKRKGSYRKRSSSTENECKTR